jgi:hypothetical protein
MENGGAATSGLAALRGNTEYELLIDWPPERPIGGLTPAHEERSASSPRHLTSKAKRKQENLADSGQEKRKRKQLEPRNEPLLFCKKKKAGSCSPVITLTAEWSVHGFAELK